MADTSLYRLFMREPGSAGGPTPPSGSVERDRRNGLPANYQPDGTNTGELNDPGVPMVTVNGDVTLTTPGQVLENVIVNGRVLFRTSNATLRNAVVTGGNPPTSGSAIGIIDCEHTSCVNALIEDVRVQPSIPSLYWGAGVVGLNWHARRVISRNGTDGFWPRNSLAGATSIPNINCWIDKCWVDGLAKFWPDPFQNGTAGNGTHNDAIQIFGGSNLTITGSVLDPWLNPTVGNTGGFNTNNGGSSTGTTTGNSAIQINANSNGSVVMNLGAMTITDNWIRGGVLTINGLDADIANGITVDMGDWLRNIFDVPCSGGYNTTTRGNMTLVPGPAINWPTTGADVNLDTTRGIIATLRRSTT